MMVFVIAFLVTLVASAIALPSELTNPVSSDYQTFELWMRHFGISYETDKLKQEKYQIWSDRVQAIKVCRDVKHLSLWLFLVFF